MKHFLLFKDNLVEILRSSMMILTFGQILICFVNYFAIFQLGMVEQGVPLSDRPRERSHIVYHILCPISLFPDFLAIDSIRYFISCKSRLKLRGLGCSLRENANPDPNQKLQSSNVGSQHLFLWIRIYSQDSELDLFQKTKIGLPGL